MQTLTSPSNIAFIEPTRFPSSAAFCIIKERKKYGSERQFLHEVLQQSKAHEPNMTGISPCHRIVSCREMGRNIFVGVWVTFSSLRSFSRAALASFVTSAGVFLKRPSDAMVSPPSTTGNHAYGNNLHDGEIKRWVVRREKQNEMDVILVVVVGCLLLLKLDAENAHFPLARQLLPGKENRCWHFIGNDPVTYRLPFNYPPNMMLMAASTLPPVCFKAFIQA